MVSGISNLYGDIQSSTEMKKETYVAHMDERNDMSIQDVVVMEEPKGMDEISGQNALEECQGMIERINCDSEDAYLLAKIAMAEAEGEDVEGESLIILVILNRVRSDKFPDSIKEVIFKENQFSPVDNGRFDRIEPNQECYEALELVQRSQWDESQGALYFDSEGKSNWHRDNLHFLFQHGNHYFYTDKELAE